MPWTGILPHSFYISSTVAQHIIDVEEMKELSKLREELS